MDDAGSAIEVEGLWVSRGGSVVLHGLTLAVPARSVTGLLGPSGSGKSTLIRAIVGVQVVQRGTVRVLGERAGSRELRPRVAYVTQAPSVYADLSVRENLRFFGRILGAGSGSVDTALETVGLEDLADRVVGKLSGGQRARASSCSAGRARATSTPRSSD